MILARFLSRASQVTNRSSALWGEVLVFRVASRSGPQRGPAHGVWEYSPSAKGESSPNVAEYYYSYHVGGPPGEPRWIWSAWLISVRAAPLNTLIFGVPMIMISSLLELFCPVPETYPDGYSDDPFALQIIEIVPEDP